ncbi:hypothetical protein [Lentzea aerocolonigenes]|uniref:hypothetical protein n=1 Tax=Lentzea aerocolonigenes TaxID=68170 RepID=UPI000A60F622|nr:hypothetical protein [Lentzea aerocolonigenes]
MSRRHVALLLTALAVLVLSSCKKAERDDEMHIVPPVTDTVGTVVTAPPASP